mmetsp:Transcript_21120/g.53199  ORF Transcript_21120/g.53199 Transcript_21120/m.53199 type:complete len:558 (+) Transcript_21120:349-2022(+)
MRGHAVLRQIGDVVPLDLLRRPGRAMVHRPSPGIEVPHVLVDGATVHAEIAAEVAVSKAMHTIIRVRAQVVGCLLLEGASLRTWHRGAYVHGMHLLQDGPLLQRRAQNVPLVCGEDRLAHLPAPHYMLSNMSLMALIAGVEARPVDGGAAAFKYLGDLGDAVFVLGQQHILVPQQVIQLLLADGDLELVEGDCFLPAADGCRLIHAAGAHAVVPHHQDAAKLQVAVIVERGVGGCVVEQHHPGRGLAAHEAALRVRFDFVAGVLHGQPQQRRRRRRARLLGVHLTEGLHRVGCAAGGLLRQLVCARVGELLQRAAVRLELILGAVDRDHVNRHFPDLVIRCGAQGGTRVVIPAVEAELGERRLPQIHGVAQLHTAEPHPGVLDPHEVHGEGDSVFLPGLQVREHHRHHLRLHCQQVRLPNTRAMPASYLVVAVCIRNKQECVGNLAGGNDVVGLLVPHNAIIGELVVLRQVGDGHREAGVEPQRAQNEDNQAHHCASCHLELPLRVLVHRARPRNLVRADRAVAVLVEYLEVLSDGLRERTQVVLHVATVHVRHGGD